ncbi:hypothetical protein AaE_001857, partial [Aphanomyces astaci]
MKDSHLGANYTRLLHAMCAKNAGFVSILVDEMLRHFTLACDKDFWYTSFRPGDRATSVSSSSLPPVNLDWSCWLARVLFAFAHHDNAAEANAVIRASNVWPTLVKAATSCNATLRHRAITVMTWYLQQDGLVGASGVPCLRFEYFAEWLAARVRKESPMRVVYSDYTQISTDDCRGWGFLANKAVWHNKSKLQTYGDMFKQGDVITVALDVDHGTLSFARNGESFGVGVDNLPSQDQGGYFPAISMYNKDDQVTFLPHDEAATGSKGAKSGIASVMRKVEAFQRLQALWTRQEPPLDVYSAWVLWTNGQLKYVVGADGNAVAVDVTDNACAPFGLQPCDVVFTPKGMCTVLGVAHHLLWYALESHNQPSGHVLAHWNVQTCRDMQSREHEFPITRHHRTHSHDAQAETPICDIVSYDDFAARQRSWTPALDEALIARLHGLAQLHRVDSMFHVTAKDIMHALEKHALDGMSAMDCLCRTGVFHASNQLLHAVIPYLASSSGAHGIPRAARHSCIVGLKFARDLIKKSTTLTLPPAATTDDDVDNDPVDLPKCKLTLPSMPCIPYWEQQIDQTGLRRPSLETLNTPPSRSDPIQDHHHRAASIAVTLSTFFNQIADPRDLRRQFTAPSTSVYSTSVQPRAFRVVCEDMPDPTASFLYALREAAREVQSPRVPLFVPVATYSSSPMNPTRKLATMVNPLEKDVILFEGVGRIMGIAWRCDVSMPWLFGPIVWKYLAGECITLADWQEGGGGVDGVSATPRTKRVVDTALAILDTREAYVQSVLASLILPYQEALAAIRRGITAIVPAACLSLLSAVQLQTQLTYPSVDLLALEAGTTYGGKHAAAAVCSDAAAGLWKLVHGYSSADQRHFCRFLSGHDGGNMSMLRLEIHLSPPMMQQPPSMPPSSCEDSNDHMMTKYGYPHVERDLPSDEDLTTPVRLYVPAYASVEMLQKKLHLAMTHHTDQTPL